MSKFSIEQLEARLVEAGQQLPYPPTPDFAGRVRPAASREFARRMVRRRLALAAGVILILFAGLLAIPPVRAAVVEFLQIGVIRIFPEKPTPTPVPEQSGMPLPTPTLLPSLLDLAGGVPPEQVTALSDLPYLAPTFPRDFGAPDYAFIQDMGGPVLILLWADPLQPSQIELSLFIFSPGTWGAEKFEPQVIAETQVNGQPAIWADGPYLLRMRSQGDEVRRLVDGQMLAWEQDGLTFRLESGWSIDDAVKAAESLQPVK